PERRARGGVRARRKPRVREVELREIVRVLRRDPGREQRRGREQREQRRGRERDAARGEIEGEAPHASAPRTRGSSHAYARSIARLIATNSTTTMHRYPTITGRSSTLIE